MENNYNVSVLVVKSLIRDGILNKEDLEDSWLGVKCAGECSEWKFFHEQRYGGCEGDGEEHWIVFRAEKEGESTKYFKVPGWYQSYSGSELEWDNLHEVEPYERTIRDWKIK